MENDMEFELEFFRSNLKDDRRRALGSALLGIIDGCGSDDKLLADCARRYAAAFKIVEQED